MACVGIAARIARSAEPGRYLVVEKGAAPNAVGMLYSTPQSAKIVSEEIRRLILGEFAIPSWRLVALLLA